VLSRYDLLLMPTLPIVATPLPEANAPIAEIRIPPVMAAL
jgi:hypothetical protein